MRVEQVGEPALLGRQQGADPVAQVRAGLVGQPPHGLVAEHRLQHLLRQHGRAAGDADLGAGGDERRAGEHRDHDDQAGRVDAVRGEPRVGAARRPLAADQVEHGALPVAHGALDGVAQVRRRAVEPRVGARPMRSRAVPAALVRHEVAARSAARSAAASTSRRDARLQRRGQLGARLGPAGDAAVSRSRSRPTRSSSVRSSSPVPTNSCQRASTSPRSSVPSRMPSSTSATAPCVGRVGVRPQPLRGVDLRPGLRGEPGGRAAGGCRARRRGCGGRPRRGARRRRPGRRTSRGAGRRRARAAGRRAASSRGRRTAARRPGRARRASRQVRGDVVLGARRHPVEHDGQRGAALLRGLQEVPRHRVGVAGGGGDEQPEVGGGEQLGGEPAVGADHGVDVGGVEDGEPGVERRRGDELERAVVGAGAAGAGQLGQHAGVGEPLHVVGVADQHGRAGGGAQHPGRGDLLADQGVHQRRLAGPGGAADDGEQRGVEAAQPGEDVVVELVDDLGPGLAGPRGTGDVELETCRGGSLAQGDEGVGEGATRRRDGGKAGGRCRDVGVGGPGFDGPGVDRQGVLGRRPGGAGRVPRRDGLGRASRGHRASSR